MCSRKPVSPEIPASSKRQPKTMVRAGLFAREFRSAPAKPPTALNTPKFRKTLRLRCSRRRTKRAAVAIRCGTEMMATASFVPVAETQQRRQQAADAKATDRSDAAGDDRDQKHTYREDHGAPYREQSSAERLACAKLRGREPVLSLSKENPRPFTARPTASSLDARRHRQSSWGLRQNRPPALQGCDHPCRSGNSPAGQFSPFRHKVHTGG